MSVDPSSLTPERDEGLVRRVWRAVVGQAPDMGPQPQQQQTTETGVVTTQATVSNRGAYSLSGKDRRAVYADADEMDDNSAEFSRALHAIADNATTSEDGEQQSFDVECEDASAKKVIDDMVARVDLHGLMPSWTRRTVKYGDSFAEIVVNNNLEVAAVKQLPSNSVNRNEDDYGNLLMGQPQYSGDICTNQKEECAFEQHDPDGNRLVATFYPWQLVHTRLFWDGINKYGISLANVARKDWRKLHALEEGMVIGRLTRAYLKLIIYAESTGMSPQQAAQMLKDLKDSISQTAQYVDRKRGRELSVLDNIYLSKALVRASDGSVHESQTQVDIIDPKNEGLTNITDVVYFQRKFLTSLILPPAFMAIEDQVNAKATLTKEDVQLVRFLRSVQKLMSGAVQQVIDTELILKGFDPASVDYEIKWPALSAEDEVAAAQSNFQQAQADDIYMGHGAIDKAWIQQHRFGMDQEEMAQIEEPAPEPAPLAVAPIPPPPTSKPAVSAERAVSEFQALAVSQQRINDRLDALATNGHNGNGKAIVAEAVRAEPVIENHVHFGPDSIRNDVTHQVELKASDVRAPDVHVHSADQPAPQVHNTVNVPKQETATVNVHVPEQPTPQITVQPSEVKVTVEQPKGEVQVERNSDGSIKSLKRK